MEKLPIIVCGEVIECDGKREEIVFEYENGVKVKLPRLTDDDISKVLKSRLKTGLSECSIDEISEVFHTVGLEWQSEECATRERAIELCSKITGYPRNLILHDYLFLSSFFLQRSELYDQLDADLGDYNVLEEWVTNENCLLHAQPQGIVTSILVGNIPVVSVFGVFRSLVVKNNTVCKIPKRDPAGAIMFGLELIKKYPNHPITKSLTIAYWNRDSKEEKEIINGSDVMCLWGGDKAITQLKTRIPAGVKTLEFGPKRSLSIIDLYERYTEDSINDIAYRVAKDFSMYNQEACFSPQEIYIRASDSDFKDFIDNLREAMDFMIQKYPKNEIPIDNAAHVLITRKEELFEGNNIISTDNHGWTMIFSDKKPLNHPLSRTIYIHRVESFDNIASFVDKFSQTVTIYPWKMQEKYRDVLTLNGVDRIVAIGFSGTPRTGFTHDSIKPFSEMVRWVSVEKDIDIRGKYLNIDKKEYLKRIKTMNSKIK
ncbi:acyl-CoA reductase [Inconstantimicrobium porci]|uniref:acyl-CoA reductase n=1 Tax=Inconstantimicrobium porci TaxID=2652291 RepID=UPI002409DA07|nr:acyl-CoA reductase [Inconstantimicrobium porci]MDD6771971.1 acyl-CoA reductase [Inconstantimicrobium porci]